MRAQFTFLTGARAGQTDVLGQSTIRIGRHGESELRLDVERDLEASTRHALLTLQEDRYLLRDLDSTNGTFVNGSRISGETPLATGDLLRFGRNGPEARFTILDEGSPAGAAGRPARRDSGTEALGSGRRPSRPSAAPSPPPAPGREPRRTQPSAGGGGAGTTTRIRLAVAHQTRGLRTLVLLLGALLAVLAGAYVWREYRSGRQIAEERQALLGRVDSLAKEITTLAEGSEGLREALATARDETASLRRRLVEAPADTAQLAELRRKLNQALQQQRNLAGVASLDARGIAAANRDAIALVFVETADHRVFTGTAFAVGSDADGGWLITSRHVVVDSATGPAAKIGVVFEQSRQNFRAEIAAVHERLDLALIRASVRQGIPVVRGLAPPSRQIEMGEPAVVIGFPHGVEVARGGEWSRTGAAATLTLGTVSRTLPDLLQLDGYGAEGSSGSPIFDRNGIVIGALYGGQVGSDGRILYAVPARFIQELLSSAQSRR